MSYLLRKSRRDEGDLGGEEGPGECSGRMRTLMAPSKGTGKVCMMSWRERDSGEVSAPAVSGEKPEKASPVVLKLHLSGKAQLAQSPVQRLCRSSRGWHSGEALRLPCHGQGMVAHSVEMS